MKSLSKKAINILKKKKITLSVAESCTGGLFSSSITSISGSSKIFHMGLITYSDDSKKKLLKISKNIIVKYGSVSRQCCHAMVKNLSVLSKSNVCLSITGIAGPNGGTKKKPVGLVYIGIKNGKKISINKYYFKNKGRSYIQKTTVKKCLNLILGCLI
jgi:nicotinamide-nucleotide amidase